VDGSHGDAVEARMPSFQNPQDHQHEYLVQKGQHEAQLVAHGPGLVREGYGEASVGFDAQGGMFPQVPLHYSQVGGVQMGRFASVGSPAEMIGVVEESPGHYRRQMEVVDLGKRGPGPPGAAPVVGNRVGVGHSSRIIQRGDQHRVYGNRKSIHPSEFQALLAGTGGVAASPHIGASGSGSAAGAFAPASTRYSLSANHRRPNHSRPNHNQAAKVSWARHRDACGGLGSGNSASTAGLLRSVSAQSHFEKEGGIGFAHQEAHGRNHAHSESARKIQRRGNQHNHHNQHHGQLNVNNPAGALAPTTNRPSAPSACAAELLRDDLDNFNTSFNPFIPGPNPQSISSSSAPFQARPTCNLPSPSASSRSCLAFSSPAASIDSSNSALFSHFSLSPAYQPTCSVAPPAQHSLSMAASFASSDEEMAKMQELSNTWEQGNKDVSSNGQRCGADASRNRW
jgi:hypothetical protein